MIERLSGDYNRGYTKAIMDIQEVFLRIDQDLKHHGKRMNSKLANELLKCCLSNRENLRESINGFIRCRVKDGKFDGFEFYEPNKF